MDTVLPPELVEAARKVTGETNRALGRKLAVAESCTGGLVSAALTEIPVRPDVFEAGFVTYSNDAKHDALKVSTDVLETFGAVSIAVAWSMAQGVIAKTQADIAVAITGIAGPDGGSDKKPVGTVIFARRAWRRSAACRCRCAPLPQHRARGRSASGCAVRARAIDAPYAGGRGTRVAIELRRAPSNAPTIFRTARSNICPASISNTRFLKVKSTQKST